MSTAELEKAVAELPPLELKEFRKWLADLEMARWDLQIASDSEAGKLDSLIEEALEEHRAVKTTPI